MDNSGRINFGVRNGRPATAVNKVLTSSAAYNNGAWHHVVGSVGDKGMYLYVDGTRVGANPDVRSGFPYDGYWRVGGDNLSGWPNRPTSDYFKGSIDEVATYRHALTGNQARSHYLASGFSSAQAPTDKYGAAVYGSGPTSYWRLAETAGTQAADASLNGSTGTYLNGVVL